MEKKDEIAVFGGGCFWCTEAVFLELQGVVSVISGYAGGHTENPTYRQVCSDNTGHAELVNIQFDPSQIHYNRLLEVFFATHDPTTLNRQGADRGTHYRSIILYTNDDQKETSRGILSGNLIVPAPKAVRSLLRSCHWKAFTRPRLTTKQFYMNNPAAM